MVDKLPFAGTSAAIKAGDKGERYQKMDSLVPGFGVRVTDKSKTFILRTR